MRTEVFLDIIPKKCFYRPNETIEFLINSTNNGRLDIHIFYLKACLVQFELNVSSGETSFSWQAPTFAPRGYGIDIRLVDETGQLLAKATTAFDVLERWTDAPRYGFLSEFTTSRPDADETMAWAARFHLNALQFYDWQYRHEALLPPSDADAYTDVLGREMSYSVVKALIDAAHRRGIAAMPYTAVYGASKAFYDQHEDWALFESAGKPYAFGDNFLMIMNPAAESPWTKHLMAQFADVLDQSLFDGIHIDQYGAPMRGEDVEGNAVALDLAFPDFIATSTEIVKAKRGKEGAVIFNAVRNWPIHTLAPSQQDAVYIEIWEPYCNLLDLHRIVVEAQKLSGGKGVIIAAYLQAEQEFNVKLANAILLASGGYYLQLGEPHALLSDPYFPKVSQLNESLAKWLAHYHDFALRYENLLALDAVDKSSERSKAFSLRDLPTYGMRSKDRIAVIVRGTSTTETFSLINLMGIGGESWDKTLPHAPLRQSKLEGEIRLERPLRDAYWLSPDIESLAAQSLEHQIIDNSLHFQIPELNYWTVLVLEYAE